MEDKEWELTSKLLSELLDKLNAHIRCDDPWAVEAAAETLGIYKIIDRHKQWKDIPF